MPTDAGSYFVILSNDTGSVTSRVAKLTVILPAALDPKVGPNTRMGRIPRSFLPMPRVNSSLILSAVSLIPI